MSLLTVIIGKKGSGKSTLIASIAEAMIHPSLIIDPGRAAIYREKGFQAIKVEDIHNHRTGVRRISHVINKKKLIAHIFGFDFELGDIDMTKAFLNGNLFCEDAASYVNANLTEDVRESVKSMKQYGLNLFLSYHKIGEISPEVLTLGVDRGIFLKTGDSTKVYSRIKKTESFQNYEGGKRAYYKAQFFGMTAQEIFDMHRAFLRPIAKDLYQPWTNEKAFAQWLCAFANDLPKKRKKPSSAQIRLKRYKPFTVDLTL